jgi:hypothetical protein
VSQTFYVYFNMKPTTSDPRDNGKYVRVVFAEDYAQAHQKVVDLIEAHEVALTAFDFELEDVWGPCVGDVHDKRTFESFLVEDQMVHKHVPLPKAVQPSPIQMAHYKKLIADAFKRMPN